MQLDDAMNEGFFGPFGIIQTAKMWRTGARPRISTAAAVSSIFTHHSSTACILASITNVAEWTQTVVAVT